MWCTEEFQSQLSFLKVLQSLALLSKIKPQNVVRSEASWLSCWHKLKSFTIFSSNIREGLAYKFLTERTTGTNGSVIIDKVSGEAPTGKHSVDRGFTSCTCALSARSSCGRAHDSIDQLCSFWLRRCVVLSAWAPLNTGFLAIVGSFAELVALGECSRLSTSSPVESEQ